MRAPVKAKTYLTNAPSHSITQAGQDKQKIRLSLTSHKKHSLGPILQSEDCLKTYFNAMPEHKRRNNLSAFNFFINKSHKKSNETNHINQHKDSKTNLNQSPQNSHKKFEPYPSLSTEKLKIMHVDSKKKLQIKTQNMKKSLSQLVKSVSPVDHNSNKINQTLSKQTKFDRKKYMYYRYRKKPIQNKSDNSIDDDADIITSQNNKKVKRLHSFLNPKINEFQNRQRQKKEPQQPAQFKRSFYRIIHPKNTSFSDIKCKLKIEPMKRQLSYSLMDREALVKTARERHRPKMMQTSVTKVFSQAIHFKSRKCKTPGEEQRETNPENSQFQNENILGWNFAEQQHEQQYF